MSSSRYFEKLCDGRVRQSVTPQTVAKFVPLAEALLVLFFERLHELSNVAAEDVVAESVGVELLGLGVVAREALGVVGDEDAAVRGTLHGAKDTCAGRSAGEANVEEALEGAGAVLDGLGHGVRAIGLRLAFVLVCEAELGQGTAGDEKAGRVGGGPVGETVLNAVARELVGVGGGEDVVALDLGVHDLADDVAVGDADDKAVLGGVVLVLGLADEALAGVVVRLALAAATVLDLVAREVGRVLDGLVERHGGRVPRGSLRS